MTAAAVSLQVRALPLRCRNCGVETDAAPVAICEQCLGPLEPLYDPARRLPTREEIAARAPSLWRYREWLPLEGNPPYSHDTGFTPLVEVPRLAPLLGVARVWVKNDAVSHPSLSFKDRVVATAINAAAAFGLDTVGCASTGNLANAVAAQAARAGLPAWIFIPDNLEHGKVVGTSVYAPNLVRIRGTYDDVNRLCAQVADRFGWGIVNVNLRSYYGEGSKTFAFEIAEQLGWRLPTAVVAPMAGGSLVTSWARVSASSSRPGWSRAGPRGSMARRHRGAPRSCGWWNAATDSSSPKFPTPSRAPSRSATRPMAPTRRSRSAGRADGRRA